MFDVAKKIDKLRKQRGWSIYRLSIEIGVTQQAIHAWYDPNKSTLPSLITLNAFCEAFGITLADFFMEEHYIDVPPRLKRFNDNWYALSESDRDTIDSLMNIMIKKK